MDPELASLVRGMLEVQAESLRLQRLVMERLLGTPLAAASPEPSETPRADPTVMPAEPEAAPTAPEPDEPSASPAPDSPAPDSPALPPPDPARPEPLEPEPQSRAVPRVEPQPAGRGSAGARYYRPRPTPTAQLAKPEDLELLRRLQQLRDASSLILQFGPYKGTTLAQVALGHPEYIRQLVISARRPEVRVAAG